MKPATFIYYESDPEPAKVMAQSLRTGVNIVLVREARKEMGEEREVCERVIVMPDVRSGSRKELHRLFGNRVEELEVVATPREDSMEYMAPPEEERPRKRNHKRSHEPGE